MELQASLTGPLGHQERRMGHDVITIDVGSDFSRVPAGRVRSDGRYSGESFREDCLVPALRKADKVRIALDGALGYGSSFLEEAFGGLLRVHDFNLEDISNKIVLESEDALLIMEIKQYLSEASQSQMNYESRNS